MDKGWETEVRAAIQVSGLWNWAEGDPCPEIGTQKEQAWGTRQSRAHYRPVESGVSGGHLEDITGYVNLDLLERPGNNGFTGVFTGGY